MKTLVTGGAGFIGSHLVSRLVEQGEEVVVLDSLEQQVHDGRMPSLPPSASFVHGDVGDAVLVDRTLDGVDRIVHLAAVVGVGQSMYQIGAYVRRNTMATATFLERIVMRSPLPSKLVVASSMSIYGEGEYECLEHGRVAPPPRGEAQLSSRRWECLCPACGRELLPVGTREEKPLFPTSVYAVTKRDHEELCLAVGRAYGIPTVALRLFNVYGPGQALSNPYTGVAAIFASRLLNERPPVIFEDGRQRRDLLHVADAVAAILLALESDGADGQAVNVGTGRSRTVAEVARSLSEHLGVNIEPALTGLYRAGDIRHCYADPSRAAALLGFEATVGFEDGMGNLADWLADQQPADRVDAATRELGVRGLAR